MNLTQKQRVVARNFMRNYGREAFRAFLAGCERDESGADWARTLGVSRERVRQWRNLFTVRVVCVTVHPEVRAIVDSKKE